MTHTGPDNSSTQSSTMIATLGFVVVALMFSANPIIARASAGEVPPFSLAFFRWALVALGLAPFAAREIRQKWSSIAPQTGIAAAAGFCGMFLCGGPVYWAANTTTAINIGLIMAAAPVNVLLITWYFGLERIRPVQLISLLVAIPGVALVLFQGSLKTLASVSFVTGDLVMLIAMLGWTGYNLLEVRALPAVSFIARTCLYAAAGATFTFPVFVYEALKWPDAVFSPRAFLTYLLLAVVPGVGAYAGFGLLGGKFGPVRASLVTYVLPVSVVVLSTLLLHEGPAAYHYIGGALILAAVWLSLRR